MGLFIFLIVYALLFLSGGLWLALKISAKRWLPKEFLYIGSLALSLSIYYVIFYLYLKSPGFAGLAVGLVLFFSFVALIDIIRRCKNSNKLFVSIKSFFLIPLLITSGIMFVYSNIFYSCITRYPATAGYHELDNRTFCHTSTLPFDNSLGYIFGSNILSHQHKKQAIDWNLVDRPPLEIAATLPILGQGSHSPRLVRYEAYYLFAVFLQLSWVGAFWGAFKVLKINKRVQIFAFLGLATTGFFYINSVFVWPKMLAASLVFTGIFILLGESKLNKLKLLPFTALLISLGTLSHSGVLFTVVPFAFYYLYKLIRLNRLKSKYVLVAIAICLLMLTPWYAYKGSVVKTDRLSKWFFAGVESASDKRGTLQTIEDQYSKISFGDWAKSKEENVKTLFTGNYASNPTCSVGYNGLINKCIFMQWRALTFFSTVFAFETLGIGWFIVAYKFVRKKVDGLDKELLGLVFAGLAFWVLVMFEGGSTIVHAGSYATMMLGFLLVIKKVSELPRFVIGSMASIQTIVFYWSWVAPYLGLAGYYYTQSLPH